jgi:hypothetical protein
MIRTKKPELYEELLQVIERRLHWFAKPGKAKNTR